ncbi:hypothetical protein TNCV_4217061 [Trichonephila clavipes]|nr:hypothetical protein TNCV_4217061 [Trichonephila clavipes]
MNSVIQSSKEVDFGGLKLRKRYLQKCLCGIEITLNSHQTQSPLVKLVVEEEKWEALDYPKGILPQNWVEPSQIVLSLARFSKLQLTTGVQLAPGHDEFRGLDLMLL